MATVLVGAPDAAPHLTGRRVGALRGAEGVADPVLDDGPDAVVLDATGWLALPAPAEPHAHLDKALTAARLPAGFGHDLPAAVGAWRAMSPSLDVTDVTARALTAVRCALSRGVTAVRTHVDVRPPGVPDRLAHVDALVDLRERLRGRVRVQLCLLAGHESETTLIEEAVERGIDVLGGCPHLAPDPHHEITRVLDVAERTGLPVDLHTDERLDLPAIGPAGLDVVDLAEQVLARGLPQRVTASHAVRLAALEPAERRPVVDLLARAGVGVVVNPITNLYLQGRDATHLAPRGLTAVRDLLDAGVAVAAGADNLRDPFNPVGRADPFETTSLLVVAAHLRPDEALTAVTTGARAVMGLDEEGADLVLVPAAGLADPVGDAIAGSADARIVLHRGRVVADTRCARTVDLAEELTAA